MEIGRGGCPPCWLGLSLVIVSLGCDPFGPPGGGDKGMPEPRLELEGEGVPTSFRMNRLISASGGEVAVGENGALARRSDVGWSVSGTGDNKELFGLAARDSNELFAVGELGKMIRSPDAGESWSNVDLAAELGWDGNLPDLHVIENLDGLLVIGGDGIFVQSDDGGQSWWHQEVAGAEVRALAGIGGRWVAGGESGELWFSPDQGTSWESGSGIGADPIIDMDMRSATEAYAADASGRIFISEDGGENWGSYERPFNGTAHAFLLDGDGMWMADGGAKLWFRPGEGEPWYEARIGSGASMFDFTPLSGPAVLAVGQQGQAIIAELGEG